MVLALPGVARGELSDFYDTEPVGFRDQPWFMNAVARLELDEKLLPPGIFLDNLLDIETKLGRKRGAKWGPRSVDLDLLLYGDKVIHEPPKLIVPHPEMKSRAFVLVPLLSLAPGLRLPSGESLAQALDKIDHQVLGQVIHQPAQGRQ